MILLFGLRRSRAKVSGLPLLWIRHGCAEPGRQHCWENSVRQPRAEQAPCAKFWGCQPLSAEQAQDEPSCRGSAGQQLSWCTGHPSGLIFCGHFSLSFILGFMTCSYPCTDYGKEGTHSAHEGIWGCLQPALHPSQLSGSSFPVNAPRISAAGVLHQAGTPLVLSPVTHRPPIPPLPTTGLAKALLLALVPFPFSRDVSAWGKAPSHGTEGWPSHLNVQTVLTQTEQIRTRQKGPARIFPLFLPFRFLHTMK